MKVGIISYFKYEEYIKSERKSRIYENWNKAWSEVFKLSKKHNIDLLKYTPRKHREYEKLIFVEIPRINQLVEVLFSNLFKKRIHTLLIINETFIGRARYILRIPYLFDDVLINCEENIDKYMSYKVKTFSYPSLPSKNKIESKSSLILNKKRKNKLVFISSFKLALSKHGSYNYRYNLVRELLKFRNLFDLYGAGWDKVPLPFDIIGIAIIIKISFLKKFVRFITTLFYKPLGSFPLAKSKEKTLHNYDFTLSIEPTVDKFNSICEKIFDPMISGSIPVYYGQNISKIIPSNTYIKINKDTTANDISRKLKSISNKQKDNYRVNIYNFLTSKKANRYRYSSYAKIIINSILN